ncbi:MAG TPA: hypothetical protein PLD23_02050 [Armatimonadota bacterium]|nr:hypothetical protein [Armatimonadota bacterium]
MAVADSMTPAGSDSLQPGQPAGAPDTLTHPFEGRILTWRSVLLCLVSGFVTVLWIRQVELIKMTCQVSESVPPIPAVAVLVLGAVLLSAWRGGLRKILARRVAVSGAGVVVLAAGMSIYTQEALWCRSVGTLLGLAGLTAAGVGIAAPWLYRARDRLMLTRAEIFGIYIFVSIVSVMSSVGGLRLVLPCLSSLRYFQTTENHFGDFEQYLPDWFGPKDPEAIRQFYEGVNYEAPTPDLGQIPVISEVLGGLASVLGTHRMVPWEHWRAPIAMWFMFLFVFFTTMLCTVALLRRQWADSERLSYPLVEFARSMTRPEELHGGKPFFRNTLMWCGFGLSVLYNVVNLLNALNPSVPALGKTFSLGQFLTEHPWNSLAGLTIHFRPEIVGLAFLISLEVLFSVWFFYGLLLVETVAMVAMGMRVAGQPFEPEQSAGAYLALGLFLLWMGRGTILRALRGAEASWGDRLALYGAIGGMALLVAFCVYAGMALPVAVSYMALLLLFGLVYARIRAETGAPLVWLFPFWQQEKMILNVAGLKNLAPNKDFRSATILSGMMFMARGFYPTMMGTQVEAFRLSDEWRGRARQMVWVILLAGAAGLLLSGWMHLTTYYQYGGNVLEGGSTQGGYRIALSVEEYTNLANTSLDPPGPNRALTEAHVAGGLQTLALILARKVFLRFPLHPLGFAMATVFGSVMWFSFFLVWVIKSIVLRVGGIRLYRNLVPLFLGTALGHFFGAGVCLGIAGLWGGDVFMLYQVWFG